MKKINLTLLFSCVFTWGAIVFAQSSGGNLAIGENGSVYIYGAHSFASGSGLISPGMIETSRGNGKGYLIFSQGSSWKGAGEEQFVDGYVQVMHDQPFVFPIGAGTTFRPVAISGAMGTSVAYYQGNPLKVGKNIQIANYKISSKEYWDIIGNLPTKVILTWGEGEYIKQLTKSQLDDLSIMGLKDGQWTPIASAIINEPVDQLLTISESTFEKGLITTVDAIIPNDYELFALGNKDILIDKIAAIKVFPNPVAKDLYIDIKKTGIVNGSIHIYDVNGRQVTARNFNDQSRAIQYFDVSDYANGLFKVQVQSTDLQLTEQFVVKNQ